MFGQSVAARIFTRSVLGAMGADPVTQAVASRIVGWATAHVTLDHHSQAMAEIGDAAHDSYNFAEAVGGAVDMHDYEDGGIFDHVDSSSTAYHHSGSLQRLGYQQVFEHHTSGLVDIPSAPFHLGQDVEFRQDYIDPMTHAHAYVGNQGYVDSLSYDTHGDVYASVRLDHDSNANRIFVSVPDDTAHLKGVSHIFESS
jgi:hypothetical protein